MREVFFPKIISGSIVQCVCVSSQQVDNIRALGEASGHFSHFWNSYHDQLEINAAGLFNEYGSRRACWMIHEQNIPPVKLSPIWNLWSD